MCVRARMGRAGGVSRVRVRVRCGAPFLFCAARRRGSLRKVCRIFLIFMGFNVSLLLLALLLLVLYPAYSYFFSDVVSSQSTTYIPTQQNN